MAPLEISNFNLAIFQKPRKPLPDDRFSELCFLILKYFPLADQISNPILTARRKKGGQLFINPIFVQFMNIETEDFKSDISMVKDIADFYFSEFKTDKINQIATRLTSIVQAQIVDGERKLVKDETYELSQENAKVLTTEDAEVRLGIRLIFRRDNKRYDLKIEPYFKDLSLNYIDFNVVMPGLDIHPSSSYNLVQSEVSFLKENVSRLIP